MLAAAGHTPERGNAFEQVVPQHFQADASLGRAVDLLSNAVAMPSKFTSLPMCPAPFVPTPRYRRAGQGNVRYPGRVIGEAGLVSRPGVL